MTYEQAINYLFSSGFSDEQAKEVVRALNYEPCEDCISRQAVLDTTICDGISCNECSFNTCEDGQRGCLLEERISKLPPVTPQPKWIPVSERLPKPFSYVDCTCHSLIDDREDWVVETCYVPQPQNSPYSCWSDWGNIPMLNDGDCEVVAWMYREIPKPYKAIDSEKEDME